MIFSSFWCGAAPNQTFRGAGLYKHDKSRRNPPSYTVIAYLPHCNTLDFVLTNERLFVCIGYVPASSAAFFWGRIFLVAQTQHYAGFPPSKGEIADALWIGTSGWADRVRGFLPKKESGKIAVWLFLYCCLTSTHSHAPN